MIVLKCILIYFGLAFIAIPATTALFTANETKDEARRRPKYPRNTFKAIFIIGFVLLGIGIALCL